MIVVEMAYKNNLSFRTLWIEIQFAKKTIACATDKTKPLLSPTMKKEQLPICQSGWKKVGGSLVKVQLLFETNSFQTCQMSYQPPPPQKTIKSIFSTAFTLHVFCA